MKGTRHVAILFLALSGVACCPIDQKFVNAVDGYTQTILPEYSAYIQADPNLSDDTKRIRTQSAEKFQQMIDDAKE